MFRCICYPIFKLLILPSKITTPLILGRIRKLRKANLRRMFYCKRLNRISNKALQLDNQLCIYELLNQGFHFKIWWIFQYWFLLQLYYHLLKTRIISRSEKSIPFFLSSISDYYGRGRSLSGLTPLVTPHPHRQQQPPGVSPSVHGSLCPRFIFIYGFSLYIAVKICHAMVPWDLPWHEKLLFMRSFFNQIFHILKSVFTHLKWFDLI